MKPASFVNETTDVKSGPLANFLKNQLQNATLSANSASLNA